MSMHASWMSFRSLTADQSVKNQKLKPGTFKRIVGFAAPYKVSLSFFMITVVIDAFLIIATPSDYSTYPVQAPAPNLPPTAIIYK